MNTKRFFLYLVGHNPRPEYQPGDETFPRAYHEYCTNADISEITTAWLMVICGTCGMALALASCRDLVRMATCGLFGMILGTFAGTFPLAGIPVSMYMIFLAINKL